MSRQPTIQTDILAAVVPRAPAASEPNVDGVIPPTGYGLAMVELLRRQDQPEGPKRPH